MTTEVCAMKLRFRILLVLAELLYLICLAPNPATAQTPQPKPAQVVNFAMLDHHGRLHELRRVGGKAVVLFFTANECPVARQSASKLRALREKFAERGVEVFMVNSSSADDRKS